MEQTDRIKRRTGRLARSGGFTLIEVMVAVIIIGLLAAIAIPSFRNITLNNSRSAAVNDLVAAMAFARGEASKRGFAVIVCPSTSGACVPSTSGWNGGWLVYAETTVPREEPPEFDDDDLVLKEFPRLNSNITISADASSFVFRSFGGRATAGTVTFCDSRGAEFARAVVVQASGKMKPSAVDGSGNTLSC